MAAELVELSVVVGADVHEVDGDSAQEAEVLGELLLQNLSGVESVGELVLSTRARGLLYAVQKLNLSRGDQQNTAFLLKFVDQNGDT